MNYIDFFLTLEERGRILLSETINAVQVETQLNSDCIIKMNYSNLLSLFTLLFMRLKQFHIEDCYT